MEINLLRSFIPERVDFGLNKDTNDGVWLNNAEFGDMTMFQTKDQYVLVIFNWNVFMQCVELSFMTALKSKVPDPMFFMEYATYVPDEDMTLDPNRATDVFRKVTYVALTQLDKHDRIGFYGATDYLDRVYTRLVKMPYVNKMLADRGLEPSQEGKFIFFSRVAR